VRKTKIICTLGPSTTDPVILREMMLAGMDVARFNFSHGDHASHKVMYDLLVRLRDELHLPIAAMLDTKGPEIRLQKFKGGKATLHKGDSFTLTTRMLEGDHTISSVTYEHLPQDISAGARILLDDGRLELLVGDIADTEIHCTVVTGGELSDHKGINLPGIRISMPYVSQRDYEDILFGIRTGFDIIAASFVRTAEDVLEIRKILDEHGGKHLRIMSKIENAEGVEHMQEIIAVSDAIMIARGDMGVEIALEEIPILQKRIIKASYNASKQVVTATQMLESMIHHPRPTRAETTDVANAIYDGTSAIMLSGETAAGEYPVESVHTMARIAERAERDIDYRKRFMMIQNETHSRNVTDAISHATCTTAYDLNAAAIITVTKSGATARMISRFRPDIPILSCTPDASTLRQSNLSWGVTPLLMGEEHVTDVLFEQAVNAAQRSGFVKPGDIVVITAGVPLGITGTTNLSKVQIVGE
ncbi:MAG: pyruvate kinase, partial [Clostridia bacterium]